MPKTIKQKPRKIFLYSKGNMKNLRKDKEDFPKAAIGEADKIKLPLKVSMLHL
jgi:hypothetical protein